MALAMSAVGEITKAGSDDNGAYYNPSRAGATKDYTYGAFLTAISLPMLTATGTTLTEVGRAFINDDIGNHVKLAGIEACFEIVSVSMGIATLDAAPGNGAYTGVLGGAGLTPNRIIARGPAVGGHWFIKGQSQVYDIATRYAVTNDGNALFGVPCNGGQQGAIEGYITTRGDGAGMVDDESYPKLRVDPGVASSPGNTFIKNAGNGGLHFKFITIDCNKSTVITTILGGTNNAMKFSFCKLMSFAVGAIEGPCQWTNLDNSAYAGRTANGFSGGAMANNCTARKMITGFYGRPCARCVALDCDYGFAHQDVLGNCEAYNCVYAFFCNFDTIFMATDFLAHSCTYTFGSNGGTILLHPGFVFCKQYNCTNIIGTWATLSADPYTNAAAYDLTRAGTRVYRSQKFPGLSTVNIDVEPGAARWPAASGGGRPQIGSRIGT
ncbi:hypothetical protein [Armatimonas sp.]|uniref:hypothetical protein n=1 Tax=Armatimonas sp. TaxID=1872638 RepID=UPI00374DCB82